MSERSYAGIEFYDVDPRNTETIVKILQGVGFYMPKAETFTAQDSLIIQDGWIDEECGVGSLHTAAYEIAERFPDTVFKAMQEADYEYAGDLDINEPQHGYFHAEIDNAGRIAFSYEEILQAGDEISRMRNQPSHTDLLGHLRKKMGVDSIDAITEWREGKRQPTHPQYVISETPSPEDVTV